MIKGQLIKKILIKGTITAKTGLHIGGSSVGMAIGGADATVVRNPLTNQPYIPGSSLKGKMRSLLEKVEGKFTEVNMSDVKNAAFVDNPDHFICKIFGTMPEKMKGNEQPTSRLIVRDCELTDKSAKKLFGSKDTDMPYTEVKTEVVIDRITSAAVPRQLERVPAGAVFNMRLILNIYDDDKENELVEKVYESLELVQNDYLGGKGTRGSGEVKIGITHLKYKDKDAYEKQKEWEEYLSVKIPLGLEPEKE
jgi:CRISPR-associated protein Csm3